MGVNFGYITNIVKMSSTGKRGVLVYDDNTFISYGKKGIKRGVKPWKNRVKGHKKGGKTMEKQGKKVEK